ncbi:regulator [Shigella dysenteriae]|uniref:Regulator n=1 Tax=Shigella dysenteriae TaxID=622 RepID=A0A2X2K5Z3_SHIDY|nr:regulator [Shigella dysenteriae]
MALLPGGVEEILNGWNSPEAQLAEQALRSGHIEALINIWENDNYSRYRPEKSVWNLYLLAQLPREMALTFWLRINEKKHLFAGEDYFLSILGLDALPGLLLAFSHRPKETFPLILNFGATELALPIARVWHRFAGQRNLARQWILQWPEHTATALIPLVFTKPSDNSEAALLALCLLYEQGHGELLQTVANRWQRADVWPALEQLLKQGPMDIYPARIPKAPDFWHPAMWSRPRLITNNQPVTDDALEIIGEMLRFTQGGRFYSGLEQLKTFCQPQTLAAFAWDLFTAWQQAGAPAKDNWAFLALSLFGDESTARDLTTQILAWPQEGKSARAVSGLNILTLMNNDMAAAHLHAMALAQLRGHTLPLRTDWLDAIAGSLIKEALNAPLPWSYRGVIHPDTDPILLTLIDTLAGDGFGKLAPSTPQPPLPKDVTCELERTAISLPAELTLNRFNPMD